jgi:RNA recognition motif-containing protein
MLRGSIVPRRCRAFDRGGDAIVKSTLYVGNLDQAVDADTLLTAFGNFGTVISVLIVVDRETGCSRGFGFVEMEDGSDRALVGLAGTELRGRSLVVKEAGQSFDELMSSHCKDYDLE